MKRLTITASNVLDCEETLRFFKMDLERLAIMTTKYPVIVEICGIREIFRSKKEIQDAIEFLDQRIAEFRQRAA